MSIRKSSSWTRTDVTRITPFRPHWLLLRDDARFRAQLRQPDGSVVNLQSIAVAEGHIAAFPPCRRGRLDPTLELERYNSEQRRVAAAIRPGGRRAAGGFQT